MRILAKLFLISAIGYLYFICIDFKILSFIDINNNNNNNIIYTVKPPIPTTSTNRPLPYIDRLFAKLKLKLPYLLCIMGNYVNRPPP